MTSTARKSKSKSENPHPHPYFITMHYKIGASDCVASFTVSAPLNPQTLQCVMNLLKADIGTSKEIFITSITCVKKGDN